MGGSTRGRGGRYAGLQGFCRPIPHHSAHGLLWIRLCLHRRCRLLRHRSRARPSGCRARSMWCCWACARCWWCCRTTASRCIARTLAAWAKGCCGCCGPCWPPWAGWWRWWCAPGSAAVGLQLQHIFAGVAVRAGEEQRQAVVQGLALAIVKRQVMGLPGL